ncbi:MAG: 50S ribosomal protein L6 [Betaproteobacteria bacterium HGW-Betaproteobacteria-11]|nr:MAG: 50S ribosomal protein L6 [Betaproteobacteria bacterium HGW-Betaproteobacteria-11]
MSRISKYPVDLPSNVEISLNPTEISVKGPLGTLKQFVLPSVLVERDGGKIYCRAIRDVPNSDAMSGTMKALISNMVTGVTKGYEKKLTLVGVGYRAQAQGSKVNLSLGFSHPVVYSMPEGIKVETPTQTEILIKGVDKQAVGQVAAEIRAYRPPEPYKGKGVRYVDEVVVIKETKKK